MSDLLLVFNVRRIPEVLAAFEALPIDKLYIRSLREWEIMERWEEIFERSKGYDRLISAGDDGIVRPHALKAVQRLLDAGNPVVTGYSNLSEQDFRVNLTRVPLKDSHPHEGAYDLYTLGEVMSWPEEAVPTFFTGYTLLGMSRELWERYPFQAFGNWPGWASDFVVSKRLTDDGVPMVAAREGFVWHMKAVWNFADNTTPERTVSFDDPAIVLKRAA